MITWMALKLLATGKDGEPVRAEEFLEPLRVERADPRVSLGKTTWQTSKILLSEARLVRKKGFEVQGSEQFERDVQLAFTTATSWLEERPAPAFDAIRAGGIKLQVLLSFAMNQDQMEFEVPPELLRCLGERRLGLHIISNDFPVAALIAPPGSG